MPANFDPTVNFHSNRALGHWHLLTHTHAHTHTQGKVEDAIDIVENSLMRMYVNVYMYMYFCICICIFGG